MSLEICAKCLGQNDGFRVPSYANFPQINQLEATSVTCICYHANFMGRILLSNTLHFSMFESAIWLKAIHVQVIYG